MGEEDPLAEFRKSSRHHRAETRASGTLILSPMSVLNFQPVARRALDVAAENNLRFKTHTVRGRRGEELYDLIIIYS